MVLNVSENQLRAIPPDLNRIRQEVGPGSGYLKGAEAMAADICSRVLYAGSGLQLEFNSAIRRYVVHSRS